MRKMVRKMVKVITVTRQNSGKLNDVDNAAQAGSEKNMLKISWSCGTFVIAKNWAWCRTTDRPTKPRARLLLEIFFAILRPHLTCDRQGRPSLSSPICLPAICNMQYACLQIDLIFVAIFINLFWLMVIVTK